MKNKKNTGFKINKMTMAAVVIIAAAVLFCALTKDPGGRVALRWIAVIFALGFCMKPYLTVDNMNFWDGAFGLSFGVGYAFSFFLAWFLAAVGICKFGTFVCYLSPIVLFAVSIVYRRLRKQKLIVWNFGDFEKYLCGFAVFLIVFLYAFWVIGYNPALDSSTENYMDFGFMESIYRQKRVAPFDIWFANEKLNYYYLGQAAAVFLCRLAGTTPEFGYNLMLCTFWAMTFVMSGEIAYAIINALTGVNYKKALSNKLAAPVAGVVASFAAAFSANGHWLYYGVLGKIFPGIKNVGYSKDFYWFPDATTFISKELGDMDYGKNEFPAYSAILGDYHAHVSNVLFVLPFIAILFDYALNKREEDKKSYMNLIACTLLLGLFKGTNFWDFAIYYVVCGAFVVFGDIRKQGFNKKTVIGIICKAVGITVGSILCILPFTIGFEKMASSIRIAQYHTSIRKMVILWGVPMAIAVILLVGIYYGKGKKLVYNAQLKESLLAFVLCTIGLVLTPEVIYIEDIYGGEHARFNTMFKLTYQSFIMFGIIVGLAVGFALLVGSKQMICAAAAMIVITIVSCGYTPYAVSQWMGDIYEPEYRKGISTLAPLYMDNEYRYDMLARDVLAEDDSEVINIMECAGDSYRTESSLSVLTGCCAPVGWFVHEWMWRDNSEIVSERAGQVAEFYESGNPELCRQIVEMYDIDYIWVGVAELLKYNIDFAGFEELGEEVLSVNEDGRWARLIRVNK